MAKRYFREYKVAKNGILLPPVKSDFPRRIGCLGQRESKVPVLDITKRKQVNGVKIPQY